LHTFLKNNAQGFLEQAWPMLSPPMPQLCEIQCSGFFSTGRLRFLIFSSWVCASPQNQLQNAAEIARASFARSELSTAILVHDRLLAREP
jgi:hypothetical protein